MRCAQVSDAENPYKALCIPTPRMLPGVEVSGAEKSEGTGVALVLIHVSSIRSDQCVEVSNEETVTRCTRIEFGRLWFQVLGD